MFDLRSNIHLMKVGFPGGSVVKNLLSLQEMWIQSLGLGRSPGEGNGNPLQYSCLENPIDYSGLVGYSPWGCKRIWHDLAIKQQKNKMQLLPEIDKTICLRKNKFLHFLLLKSQLVNFHVFLEMFVLFLKDEIGFHCPVTSTSI